MTITPSSSAPVADARAVAGAVRWTVIAFILLSATLCLTRRWGRADDGLWTMRSAAIGDLVRQRPIGNQALVSSLGMMPLESLTALPFVPFVRPHAYGYAYLYGVALIAAVAVVPLARQIRRRRAARPAPWIAVATLVASAAALGGAGCVDLFACASCLTIAMCLEGEPPASLRALSGVFWGCAFLSHPVGAVAALVRALLLILRGSIRPATPEGRAVAWIQCVTIAYVVAVYLFLNWIIMNDPLYPLEAFQRPACSRPARPSIGNLPALFDRDHAGSAPVVSGHWGYQIGPFLRKRRGYHFIDFHPDKIPNWERRNLVLIQPAEANPLSAFADLGRRLNCGPSGMKGCILLNETPDWRFYAVGSTNDCVR